MPHPSDRKRFGLHLYDLKVPRDVEGVRIGRQLPPNGGGQHNAKCEKLALTDLLCEQIRGKK